MSESAHDRRERSGVAAAALGALVPGLGHGYLGRWRIAFVMVLPLIALVGLVVLAFYHPALLAFDLVLITGAALVLIPLGRGGTNTSIAESKAKYAVAGWLEEMALHPLSFKLSGGQELGCNEVESLAKEYLDKRDRHFRIVFRQVVGALTIEVVASVALLAVGGLLVIERQLSIGQLVAAELIVTTDKDRVRLEGLGLDGLELHALQIELELPRDAAFRERLAAFEQRART